MISKIKAICLLTLLSAVFSQGIQAQPHDNPVSATAFATAIKRARSLRVFEVGAGLGLAALAVGAVYLTWSFCGHLYNEAVEAYKQNQSYVAGTCLTTGLAVAGAVVSSMFAYNAYRCMVRGSDYEVARRLAQAACQHCMRSILTDKAAVSSGLSKRALAGIESAIAPTCRAHADL